MMKQFRSFMMIMAAANIICGIAALPLGFFGHSILNLSVGMILSLQLKLAQRRGDALVE